MGAAVNHNGEEGTEINDTSQFTVQMWGVLPLECTTKLFYTPKAQKILTALQKKFQRPQRQSNYNEGEGVLVSLGSGGKHPSTLQEDHGVHCVFLSFRSIAQLFVSRIIFNVSFVTRSAFLRFPSEQPSSHEDFGNPFYICFCLLACTSNPSGTLSECLFFFDVFSWTPYRGSCP